MDMEHWIYLVSNVFVCYTLIRFVILFLPQRKPRSLVTLAVHFVLFVAVNSSFGLLFSNPILNVFTMLCFLFSWTFHCIGPYKQKLIATTIPYVTAMLLDSIIYYLFYNNLTTLGSGYNNIVLALSLYLLVLILEKLFSKKINIQLDFIHWLVIFTVPLGTIFITLIICTSNYASVETLLVVIILLINNVVVL